jgi:UDP-N-acetylglucosamine diphosphorylase / glucose-1-phosphate thymidylyltransferase / UDP-N-acetylgalactosamine diphosphorylase / glucosamine-1-phosphate N-acetyltransferase / galactosamine-1-phosphate N-acetyltransferase
MNAPHYLQSLLDRRDDCPASSLSIFGHPLIVHNILVVQNILNIDTVSLPATFSTASTLIQNAFPTINVNELHDEYRTNGSGGLDYRGGTLEAFSCNRLTVPKPNKTSEKLELPINSLLYYCCSPPATALSHYVSPINNIENKNSLMADVFMYPWEFLNAVGNVLQNELTHTIISPTAAIAKTSVIQGPCLIEDDVVIDDFCKIVGPTYLGNGSFIGMSSLVRSSMLGTKTSIGFNCEIARAYFEGYDTMAHQNVILDSIIGKDVWFGGYSGTANVLLNKKNVRFQVGHRLLDTGAWRFGVVVGNNCAVGADVIILPGREVPSNSVVQAGTVIGRKDSQVQLNPSTVLESVKQ